MAKFKGAQPTKPGFSGEKPLSKPTSTNAQKPLFSFEYMASGTGYSVDCCEVDERAQLSSKLFRLGRMTWGEINQSGRHKMGSEVIPRGNIAAPIPAAVTEDARFLAFRYNGLKAMVGYRADQTFHILFLDHNFTLYPHGD